MSRPLTGLSAWLVQRLSAIYLAFSAGAGALLLWQQPATDYAAWKGFWETPVVGAGAALLFVALLLHSWVGVRDIILDYASRSTALRLVLLSLLGAWLMLLGVWMFSILLSATQP